MRADFGSPPTCTDYEFRQFVQGYQSYNGADHPRPLPDNKTLSRTTPQEDGYDFLARMKMYGRRSERANHDGDLYYEPKNRDGCKYLGSDRPRMCIRPTDQVAEME